MRSAIVTCFSARHGRASSVRRPAPELLPLHCMPGCCETTEYKFKRLGNSPLAKFKEPRCASARSLFTSGAVAHEPTAPSAIPAKCDSVCALQAPDTVSRLAFFPRLLSCIREPVSVTHRFIRFALSIDPKAAWLMLLLITRGLSFDSRLRRRRCFLDVAEKISNEK